MIRFMNLLRYYNQCRISRTLQLHVFLHLYSCSSSSVLVEEEDIVVEEDINCVIN